MILWFHYLMDLHYSQTFYSGEPKQIVFHYLMDLHYSQTLNVARCLKSLFHYLMDLHYSQTLHRKRWNDSGFTTLWIYTILKPTSFKPESKTVSLPYGFTLFSNSVICAPYFDEVSLPYGFTLFSNKGPSANSTPPFHYLMDLHYSQTNYNRE